MKKDRLQMTINKDGIIKVKTKTLIADDEIIVKTARIDEIINFVNLLSSDIERSASETIVKMLENLKGN